MSSRKDTPDARAPRPDSSDGPAQLDHFPESLNTLRAESSDQAEPEPPARLSTAPQALAPSPMPMPASAPAPMGARPLDPEARLARDAAALAIPPDVAAQIPMLTEVVPVQHYDKARLPVEWTEADWERLADRVRDTLLERLLRTSDSMLQDQFEQNMRPTLDRMVDELRDQMRVQVEAMVRDVVARGITDELGRVHAEIARRQRSRGARS